MEKNEYKAIIKPDSVSLEEIADVLHDAHRANEKKGMHFQTGRITAEELSEHLGDNGEFFVVMDGDKVCAVAAIRYRTWDKWFCKGELCGDFLFLGVREEYKGLGLSTLLSKKREEEAFKKCNILTMNTATNNKIVLDSRLRSGWRYVDYFSHDETDFYSIMLAKWKGECPYSEEYCKKMFNRRKRIVRLVRKKDGSIRFPANLLLKK